MWYYIWLSTQQVWNLFFWNLSCWWPYNNTTVIHNRMHIIKTILQTCSGWQHLVLNKTLDTFKQVTWQKLRTKIMHYTPATNKDSGFHNILLTQSEVTVHIKMYSENCISWTCRELCNSTFKISVVQRVLTQIHSTSGSDNLTLGQIFFQGAFCFPQSLLLLIIIPQFI
jgi:hypothetical protein